jgi:hypothetical protein
MQTIANFEDFLEWNVRNKGLELNISIILIRKEYFFLLRLTSVQAVLHTNALNLAILKQNTLAK